MRSVLRHMILCCILLSQGALAQIPFQGISVPAHGDTVWYKVDQLPQNISPLDQRTDRRWDFRGLLAPFSRYKTTVSNNPGHAVEYAFKMIDDFGQEHNYETKNDTVFEVGRTLTSPFSKQRIQATFSGPYPYKMNMQYGDSMTWTGAMIAPLKAGQVKDHCSLDITPGDRIRLRVDYYVRRVADNYGMLNLDIGEFPVLREKQVIQRQPHIERKSGSDWQDICDQVYNQNLIEEDTHIAYLFWNQDYPEPVVRMICDMDERPLSIEFLSIPDEILQPGKNTSRPDIFVYPNPSPGSVRFDFYNLPPGDYTVEIYNILGVKLMEQTVFVENERTIQMDLSRLKKGTYIYRLLDQNSNALRSKRLVIITP